MLRLFINIGALLLLSACTDGASLFKLNSVEDEGQLVVLTRYSTTSYIHNYMAKPSGFEHDLVKAFANDMGWKVKFIVKNSTQEIIEDLALGRAHMAAASLTITEDRKELFKFSNPYHVVNQEVVCGKPQNINKLKDLSKLKLTVVEGTSHEETMAELAEEHEGIDYKVHDETSEETLEMIWDDRDLCTVIDSHTLSVHRLYFPELRVVYEISDKEEIAWAFNSTDKSLIKKVNTWLAGRGQAYVKQFKNKYYGHVKDFDYYDTKKFLERIETRLPKFKKIFQEAGKKTGMKWTFLAAVSYQESQWDPKAISPTGVRGLMMLTRATAKEMGIKDRLDPAKSVDGGSRYLLKQMRRMPPYVRDDDRKWFALASYNVGYYHLRDAMALAVLENKNPGSWSHVREVLPLLSKRKYFKKLRYGYARGLEPVIYVTRIRNYHKLLLNHM